MSCSFLLLSGCWVPSLPLYTLVMAIPVDEAGGGYARGIQGGRGGGGGGWFGVYENAVTRSGMEVVVGSECMRMRSQDQACARGTGAG